MQGHFTPFLHRRRMGLMAKGLRMRNRQTHLLSTQQIQKPATPVVRPFAAAVREDVGVRATGVFQSISEDGELVEGTLFVDGLRYFGDRALVPGQPGGVDGGWPRAVANDLFENANVLPAPRNRPG